jgi:hypothetical protein
MIVGEPGVGRNDKNHRYSTFERTPTKASHSFVEFTVVVQVTWQPSTFFWRESKINVILPNNFNFRFSFYSLDFTATVRYPARRISARVNMKRKLVYAVGGLAAYVTGVGAFMAFRTQPAPSTPTQTDTSQDTTNHSGATSKEETKAIYNSLATTYDSKVGLDETLIGITRLRKSLAQQARGHVLELCAGMVACFLVIFNLVYSLCVTLPFLTPRSLPLFYARLR